MPAEKPSSTAARADEVLGIGLTADAWLQHAAGLSSQEQTPKEPVAILNRPRGEQTERPMINIGELAKQDRLEEKELKPFLEADGKELDTVAGKLSALLGKKIDRRQALGILVRRMKMLWYLGIKSYKEHDTNIARRRENLEMRTGYIPEARAGVVQKLWNLLAVEEFDRVRISKGQRYVRGTPTKEELASIAREQKQLKTDAETPLAFDSGRTYDIDFMTAASRTRPGTDCILTFMEPDGKIRMLRLNTIQLGVAQQGLTYKGEPTDDEARRENTLCDQAAYPRSFLSFYTDHLEPWLTTDPAPTKKK